ncbi:MAG: RsmD family RNA methyltransferase, partial [Cutibacterium avidum]|nr:RsmD family RNA methyltransferase [Cutibacterium avidum]
MSRIISGRAGGQRLATPSGRLTRPTTDRVREAVFSALAAWNGTSDEAPEDQLAGQAFCDLFAGSGAVALEAASRGASTVLAVDRDRSACHVMTENART